MPCAESWRTSLPSGGEGDSVW
uniref:Uncharacterized protein n=1 Tax=Arundo donax TaxID=35708 RepID=A0A0A9GBX8_ARUDO